MTELEISREYDTGVLANLNQTNNDLIVKHGLEEVVHVIEIPNQTRAVIADPQAVDMILTKTGWSAVKLKEFLNGDDNRGKKCKLRSSSSPLLLDNPNYLNKRLINFLERQNIQANGNFDKINVCADPLKKPFAVASLIKLYDHFDLKSLITKLRAPSVLVGWVDDDAASNQDYDEAIESYLEDLSEFPVFYLRKAILREPIFEEHDEHDLPQTA